MVESLAAPDVGQGHRAGRRPAGRADSTLTNRFLRLQHGACSSQLVLHEFRDPPYRHLCLWHNARKPVPDILHVANHTSIAM
jgi:hypothetical protein